MSSATVPSSDLRPSTVGEAAEVLRDLARAGQPVRPVGVGSRASWGGRDAESTLELSTASLNRIREHNPGDFTAVIEAGVSLADAQAVFGAAGQWLAVDPPEPSGSIGGGPAGGGPAGGGLVGSGTIGGLVATGDSGPVRHRYGAIRDLVIGITVALSDGTVASSGGKVIKNVAGYDLGKLFTGSYGTLGLITSVAVRLHPRPTETVTLRVDTDDPARLGTMAVHLARAPLEALSLDAWWRDDRGGLLIRFAGRSAAEQAELARRRLAGSLDPVGGRTVEVSVVDDDEAWWTRQRSWQRGGPDGITVKVSGRITDLPDLVAAVRAAGAPGTTLTSRAGLGLSFVTLAPAGGDGGHPARPVDETLADLRQRLAPRAVTVLDGSTRVEQPWPVGQPGVLAVMARVKARFDPAGVFRPGSYLGGL